MKTSIVLWMMSLCTLLSAQPSGPSVRHGNVQFEQAPNQLRIQQLSDKAVVNWQSFSIPAGHAVNIAQPGSHSALLNRVTGADPSRLMGQLTANGRVFLINPNGIVVGAGARIDAGAFIASTLDLSDTDFLAGGDMLFSGSSTAGVKNLGTITASNGDVILIGYSVENQGALSASGTAALAAGREVILSPASDPRIRIVTTVDGEAGDAATGVDNQGLIEAAQAELQAAGSLYELAVNQQGIIRATGVEQVNGRVLLTAAGGTLAVDGTLSARNADGSGGEILVGGDLRGDNPAIANAATTRVAASAVIDVSADSGNAGRAIVWADGHSSFEGTILARGAEAGGDGGFAEVSGKQTLSFQGVADLRAPAGRAGDLLLDPASLTITSTPPDFDSGDPAVPSTLTNSTLQNQLALGNVTLDTSTVPDTGADGSIVVDAPVTWSSSHTLTFHSGNNITVNQPLEGPNGGIVFGLGFVNDGNLLGGATTTANLFVDAAAPVTADTVAIQRNPNAAIQFTNSQDGPAGGVNVLGILTVNTLDLQAAAMIGPGMGSGGFQGAISIENPGNNIGTLTSTVSTGTFQDEVKVVDGQGGLSIDGSFTGAAPAPGNPFQPATPGGSFTFVTPGDLTLTPGTVITTTDRDIVLASTGGSFINQAGITALAPGGSGRFLVYSDDPANLVADGLVADPVYNKTWAGNPPASLSQTGNRFVYSLAPTLTLTANNASKVSGDPNPTFTFSVSGLVGGDTAGEAFSGTPDLSTTADLNSSDGSYTITITAGTVTLSDFDYALNLVNGLLTVDPAALPQLLIAIQNAIRQFGDVNPQFVVTYTGFLGNDNENMVSGLQISTAATEQSSVGNYAVTPSGATAPGYDIVFQPGNLQVTPREVTLRAGDLSKTYGDALPAFTTSFENLPAFAAPADLGTVSVVSAASPLTAAAGNYDIVPSVTGNPNYNVTPANGTATVNKRPATITAPSVDREYGLANPAFVASGSNFLSGEFNNSSLSFNTAAVPASDVDTYTLTASGHNDMNYLITYLPGQVEVTPATLTLTADPQTREYGLANPALTYTDSGLRLGQVIDDVVPDLTLGTPATQSSNVGSFNITFSGTPSNPNYTVNFVNSNLTITKAPLLIVPTLNSRFFGDDNPDFELTAIGLRNSDTAEVVTQKSFQVFASPQSNVGSYPVQILAATATNYTLSFNNGTLNVLPRPLTITADSHTREYGDVNPPLTAQFDNLAPFHTEANINGLSVTTPATQTSNVLPGGYGINVSTGSNPNYNITTVPGTLMITPAPLEVTVDNATRAYASANPAFSATTDGGLKAGDTVGDLFLNFSTPAVPQSDVGSYPITAASANPNYAFTFAPGELAITPAQLAVVGTPFDRIYGDPLPGSYNLNVQGLAFGATAGQVVEVDDPTTRATGIGLYSYSVRSTDPNYEIGSFFGNNFRILQRPLDISIEDIERFYGDNNPAFVLRPGSNLLPDLDPLENVLVFTAPNKFELPGNYSINASIINSNYRFNLRGFGRLTILPRPLRIEMDNQARYYGALNPAFTFREVGGVGFPDFIDPASVIRGFTFVSTGNNSAPGYYLIGASTTINEDRRFRLESLRPGILTIAPRPVSLFIDDLSRQYAHGTPLNEIAIFSDFKPAARLDNTVNGDTLASVFPGLTLAFVEAGAEFKVETQPALSALSRPSLDAFGSTDLTVTPASRSFIPFRRSGGSTVRSASTAVRPVTFTLSADGNSLVADRPISLSGGASTRRLAIIPTGEYQGASANYILTDVSQGLLTLTERSYFEELNYLRANDKDRYNELANPILEVRSGDSLSLYARNLGFFFRDYQDLGVDMISEWLQDQFTKGLLDLGQSGLWFAIFGDSELKPPAFDRFTIRQWLSDIHANPDKRQLLGGALHAYTLKLQSMDPGSYTPGQKRLADTITEKFMHTRDAFAGELLARKATYDAFPNASTAIYGAREQMMVISKRAAVAATGFLSFEKNRLTEAETDLLTRIQGAILDGDNASTIAMLEEWVSVRGDKHGSAFIDTQYRGMLRELIAHRERRDAALASIEAGQDYASLGPEGGMHEMYDMFGTPYGEFLMETSFATLEAKMSRYDLVGELSGVTGLAAGTVAGVATAGGVLAGGQTVAGLVMPFRFATVAGVKSFKGGMAFGSGAGAAVLATTAVFVSGTIMHVQDAEQKKIFEDVTAEHKKTVSLADLDLQPDTRGPDKDIPPAEMKDFLLKSMLAEAMDEMLLGL